MEFMETHEKLFNQFDYNNNYEQAVSNANDIIKNEAQKNYTKDNLKTIYGCLDLTSLSTLDTEISIQKLVEDVNSLDKNKISTNVAAICVYPIFAGVVKKYLTAKEVNIASVSCGFPASQTFKEIKVAETTLAVMSGAQEIDIVINIGKFNLSRFYEVEEEIKEIKESAHGALLKVIIETGALRTIDNISKATIISIHAGADFIKTSTGKEFSGATPEGVYAICQIIKQFNNLNKKKIGIKISGGIRTAEDAINYYSIVKSVLGEDWLNKKLFRIGASSLAEDLINKINPI
jgi:deoxyribose-phosphate aldolase